MTPGETLNLIFFKVTDEIELKHSLDLVAGITIIKPDYKIQGKLN